MIILGFLFLDWEKPWAATFVRGCDHLCFVGLFCIFSIFSLVSFLKQLIVASLDNTITL